MSQTEIGLIGFAVLAVLMLAGMDVGYTMLLAGCVGFALIGGWDAAMGNLAIQPYDTVNSYSFSVLPLFLLMGSFVTEGGLGAESYQMARIWLSKLKGGLAIATLFASAMFGAMSGSSLAGSLVMGRVAYPEMRKQGYKMSLAAGVVSVGGTLDLLIPPSMAFIMIGIMADLDVGKLYMGAIMPGIVVTVFYMVTVWIWCKINPKLAPTYTGKFTWRERLVSLRLTWPVLVLFLLVMGGMYAGVFTSTEAGAVGALGALIIPLAKRQMSRHGFWKSLKDTARTLSMFVILLTGANLFGAFMAVTQIPNTFGNFLLGLGISRWAIYGAIVIFYIAAGTFFDPYSILIITIPIFYPAMQAMGFDLIWFSVIMVRLLEIGNISPPAGINLYGLKGVIDAPLIEIYRGVTPFLISDVFNLVLLSAFPIISTFLAESMRSPFPG